MTAGIGRISGLPWSSGINGSTSENQAFIDWRGRLLDVRTVFFGIRDWTHMSSSARGLNALLSNGRGRPVIALGMLPRTHVGQLGQCALGQFDPQIRAVANNILNNGGRSEKARGYPMVIRLGWEANNEGSYPWAATGDGTSWRDCFKRWVDILNPVGSDGTRQKNFLIVWNMANKGTITYPIDNLWPGGEYVDIVGSQAYDRCAPLIEGDRYAFEARLDARTYSNNPAGPRAWLEYAKAKGKPWAAPEWGIGGQRDGCAEPGYDNPYFVQKMYEFFWNNRADIAFEAYFNDVGGADPANGTHELFAPTPGNATPAMSGYNDYVERYNPRAAAMYRSLWGGAKAPVPEPPPEGPPEPPAPPPASDTLYWLRYIASHDDLIKSLGTDASAGYASWVSTGKAQKRTAHFDPQAYLDMYPAYKKQFGTDLIAATRQFITYGYPKGQFTYSNGPQYWLRYIASHVDLIPKLRTQATAGEAHYYNTGIYEGRTVTFDALAYLKADAGARAACGSRDQTCAAKYFINSKL